MLQNPGPGAGGAGAGSEATHKTCLFGSSHVAVHLATILCSETLACYHCLSSVQFNSFTQSCLPPCNPMDCSMPGFPVYHQLLELAQTHIHRVGDAIQPSRPLSSPLLLPLIFPSIRVFSSESALRIRWPKYQSFSFSISPSNEYSGLISFRMDWLVLLAVQGTLKSLLQHHSSKASIHWCSAFFMVQLSHLYTTTGKTTALTRWTFVRLTK